MESKMASQRETIIECETCKRLFTNMDTFRIHNCSEPDSGGYDADTFFMEHAALELQPAVSTNSSIAPSASTSSPSTGPSSASIASSQPVIWNRPSTLCLIDLYETNEHLVSEGRVRKKALWTKISNLMRNSGHDFTAAQCEGRWKTLVRGIKNVKDHNKKSGNSRKTHPFEDELQFIVERPNINPVFVATTAATATTASTDIENEDTPDAGTDSETTPKRRRVNKSAVSEVVGVMQAYIEKQEERHEEESRRLQTMHNDRMGLFREFLNVLGGRKEKEN